MEGKIILIFVILAFLGLSFAFYWFIPFDTTNFESNIIPSDKELYLNSLKKDLQFYDSMRFPEEKISYNMYECNAKKISDMENAFKIISNLTPLKFYSVESNEEISIYCEEKEKNNQNENGLFIAGEGGPTNITKTTNFNVIHNGKIILMRESNCETNPNIAIHELLHVLGFDHSQWKKSVMYNITECDQIIEAKVISLIKKLYLYPSYPDLTFENVSLLMKGRYMHLNMSIRNKGLKEVGESKIRIFADKKLIHQFLIPPLEIGYGREIYLSNVLINQFKVDEIILEIESSSEEINKENNKVILRVL